MVERGCQCNRPAGFKHNFKPGEGHRDGPQAIFFRHDESRPAKIAHERKGHFSRAPGDNRIANTASAAVIALPMSSLQRACHVVEIHRLNRPHAHVWCLLLQSQSDPRGQTAAAATHQNIGLGNTHSRRLFRYFQTTGALTGDHFGRIIGFDEAQSARLSQGRADRLAILTVSVI